ncbi:Rhs family protein [Pseudomonas chlororaphis subsp. aurantiaca]|nr:RHS repeat domain-containing protein [Pseudomonas chlororaphis]AZD70629.1 Rhs family protein [Pseudomonas chlororaphis subsp. aurantiaca]AZD76831.1 Rhs family protein [Pseudomonas chlororaphis subsp. aurantiaca]
MQYRYDAFGNLSRERRGAGQKLVTEYQYDCQHRLIGVRLTGGRPKDRDRSQRRSQITINPDMEQVSYREKNTQEHR